MSQTLNRLTLLPSISPNTRYRILKRVDHIIRKENSSRCPSSSLGPVKGVGPFSLCCTPLTLATQCPETHAVLSENTIRLQSKELYVDQRQSPSKRAARADYLQIQTPHPRAKQEISLKRKEGGRSGGQMVKWFCIVCL